MARFIGFFPIVLKRLTSKFLLTLLVFLTMSLTVGITVGIPAFADAVSLRILRQEFSLGFYSENLALFYVRVAGYPTTRQPVGPQEAVAAREEMGQMIARSLGLPLKVATVELG